MKQALYTLSKVRNENDYLKVNFPKKLCAYLIPRDIIFNNEKGKYPEFCICHSEKTWYVGCGGQVLPARSVVTTCAYLIPRLHICSDRVIKKGNYPVRATPTKLGVLVISGGVCVLVISGSCGYRYYRSFITECAYLIPHLHICYNK